MGKCEVNGMKMETMKKIGGRIKERGKWKNGKPDLQKFSGKLKKKKF
jgi:hypothetical protein